MNARQGLRVLRAAAAASICAVAAVASAPASANPCAGLTYCFNGGNFTADVLQVVTAKQDGVTAYNTVRVTVRFRNISRDPLILAHRLGTNVLIDSNGNAYGYFNNRANRITGIGIVQPNSADTQFQLAPGEARNAIFENVIQYSPARTVLGSHYSLDIVIEQLALIGGQQVRTVRSHAISFTGLTRGSTDAAASAAAPAMPAPAAPSGPIAVVTTPQAPTASGSQPMPDAQPVATEPTPVPAPTAQPGAPVATPAGDPCAAAPNRCFNAGPFIAQVTQLTVANTGGVTAYQTVRITLAIRNVSSQPLILGYKLASHVLVDDRGNRYTYFNNRPQRVTGIGIVQPGQADAQFRLAPGQSRNATFESVHQYSSRRTVMGNVYNFDLVLVQLEPLSPTQVRTAREFALNYANLRQGSASPVGGDMGSLPQGGGDAVETVQKAVDLFKSLTKPR